MYDEGGIDDVKRNLRKGECDFLFKQGQIDFLKLKLKEEEIEKLVIIKKDFYYILYLDE